MKPLYFFALIPLIASGQQQWNIGEMPVKVDTLYHFPEGPGTTETALRLTGETNDGSQWVNNVFYTETDLNTPYVEMRAAKAGNSNCALEVVPDISKRFTTDNTCYFAGVNADFFNMGEPFNAIGNCIADGYLTNRFTPGADLDSYYIDFDDKGFPALTRHVTIGETGSINLNDGSNVTFHINSLPGENSLTLLTPQWRPGEEDANNTALSTPRTEVYLAPVDGRTMFGKELTLEVVTEPLATDCEIVAPQDGYLLTALGDTQNLVSALRKGDKLTATVEFKAMNKDAVARELIGGYPIILKDYNIESTPEYPPHLWGPEPRTAVGYNADGSRVFLVVVDGRNAGGSLGANQKELAYIMKNIGCKDAMNFDGGGSTTLYVDKLGIRNTPSSSTLDNRAEGQPRKVVNGLFAVSTAPQDPEIASLAFTVPSVNLTSGNNVQLQVVAYNKYGNIIDPDFKDYEISLPRSLGKVNNGCITPGTGKNKGQLTIKHGKITATIPVYLNHSR